MFRSEPIERSRRRLAGHVHLFVPLSWDIVGYTLLAILLTFVCLIWFGSYAHVEAAKGYLEPSLGQITVPSQRSGIIVAENVHEGSKIAAGAAIATIRSYGAAYPRGLQRGSIAPTAVDEPLRAPASGIIVDLEASVGQVVHPGSAVTTITPEGSHLEAWINVPASAVTSLKVGQSVNLNVDGPQTGASGRLSGRIAHVSNTPMYLNNGLDSTAPYYLAKADVSCPRSSNSAPCFMLRVGMPITSEIVTSRLSFAEWLSGVGRDL